MLSLMICEFCGLHDLLSMYIIITLITFSTVICTILFYKRFYKDDDFYYCFGGRYDLYRISFVLITLNVIANIFCIITIIAMDDCSMFWSFNANQALLTTINLVSFEIGFIINTIVYTYIGCLAVTIIDTICMSSIFSFVSYLVISMCYGTYNCSENSFSDPFGNVPIIYNLIFYYELGITLTLIVRYIVKKIYLITIYIFRNLYQ
jgi:hypothetical protein